MGNKEEVRKLTEEEIEEWKNEMLDALIERLLEIQKNRKND